MIQRDGKLGRGKRPREDSYNRGSTRSHYDTMSMDDGYIGPRYARSKEHINEQIVTHHARSG